MVLTAEWTKIRTVRSTVWTLLAAVVLGFVIGAVITTGQAVIYEGADAAGRASFDPVSASLQGEFVAQLLVGLLGVMVVTSEFATGTMVPSLTSVPRRGRFLAAKAVVLGAVTVVMGEVIAFPSFFAGQALLAARDVPHASLTDGPEVVRAVLGYGLYMGLIGLFGLALGLLLRSTAASLTVLAAVVFIIPVLSGALPESVQAVLRLWWPSAAGSRIMTTVPDPDLLGPWPGLAVFAGFVAVLLGVAFAVFRRRDV
jgi:ABC-type transport system involved in multi-copper enzyme maturation permease subunit